MAKLTGKEDALFMPSGTMSNQIALRSHLMQPPYSILCDHRAHIHRYEAGGAAFHSGAAVHAVIPANGESYYFYPECNRAFGIYDWGVCSIGHHLTLEDVQAHAVLDDNIHT